MLGLFKTFYGRYAGTEGNLKTEVIDVNLIDVPDPRDVPEDIVQRLGDAFKRMCKREVGGLIEYALRDCHTHARAIDIASRRLKLPAELMQQDRRDLDDAVFEILGVADGNQRSNLIDRLYEATTRHFRDVRVTEIQKMEDRRSGGATRFAIADHAADAWDAIDLTDLTPMAEWVKAHVTGDCEMICIPPERPVYLTEGDLYDNETVFFGKSRRIPIICQSRGEAELIGAWRLLG